MGLILFYFLYFNNLTNVLISHILFLIFHIPSKLIPAFYLFFSFPALFDMLFTQAKGRRKNALTYSIFDTLKVIYGLQPY